MIMDKQLSDYPRNYPSANCQWQQNKSYVVILYEELCFITGALLWLRLGTEVRCEWNS